jgi:hypothetical protein
MFPLVVFVSVYLGAYSLIASCIFCICLIPVYFVLAGLPAWLLNLNTYLHFYQKKNIINLKTIVVFSKRLLGKILIIFLPKPSLPK